MSDNDDDKDLPTFSKEVSANLFKARTIFIYGSIDQKVSARVCAELVALSTAGDEDIKIFVNSPGGHVESGDSIYDMIKFIDNRVVTIGTGWVASAGA